MGKHKGVVLRGSLTERQRNLFVAGTNFLDESGRLRRPFREMSIGQNINSTKYTANRVNASEFKWFRDIRRMEMPDDRNVIGSMKRGHGRVTRTNWAVISNSKGNASAMSFNQFYMQIVSIAHQIPIATSNWKLVLAHRALAVFRQSFTLKRFNSDGAKKWPLNTAWTRKKRKSKKPSTWPGANRLMQETNALYKSIKLMNTFTFTGVTASARYAGVHNCPTTGMTYGNGFGGIFTPPKPVTQRQFMGHSTEIDKFIATYERRYLFDTIFREIV